ncbi:MAG: DUF192 domain-containing protein [Bdellovibrionales bacterium]|nr:DUF192 domain-containing protein [Bdellovibrionales bacterium]
MFFKRNKLLFVCCALFAGSFAHAEPQKLESHEFQLCGRKIQLELARTQSERTKGLMDRAGIPAGTGMIFQFDAPEHLVFWMKHVPFDIDIGFFDQHGKLQKFMTMLGTSPLMQDAALPRYEGPELSLYAIEVPAGFFRPSDRKGCRLHPLPTIVTK